MSEEKIKLQIKELKSRLKWLEVEELTNFNVISTINFGIEVLEECLVSWIPMACIECKQVIEEKMVPETQTFLCKRCMTKGAPGKQ